LAIADGDGEADGGEECLRQDVAATLARTRTRASDFDAGFRTLKCGAHCRLTATVLTKIEDDRRLSVQG
jgi:hypothetical protein